MQLSKEMIKELYDIAQINAFSEAEYKRLLIEVDQTVDRVARTTVYDRTGVTPDLNYTK